MDITTIISYVKDYVPAPVIIAVIVVIMLVKASLHAASLIEQRIEEKKGRQIKIFEHKKIWLSVFWCVVLSVALAIGGFIEWKETFYYWLLILGANCFLYEAFFKKTGIKKDD